jgi:hypothetical protein
MAVTSLARTLNPKIGDYQELFINEDFGFSIRLSNGSINISLEVAQDYEAQPSSVTHDRIERVVNSFRLT